MNRTIATRKIIFSQNELRIRAFLGQTDRYIFRTEAATDKAVARKVVKQILWRHHGLQRNSSSYFSASDGHLYQLLLKLL